MPSSETEVQRLESALAVGNIAWWEMDCATGAVRFHRRKTDMLGYDSAAFTHYTDFTALLHPDDLEPAMQAMRAHLAGEAPEYRVDYRLKAKSGDYRWFEDVGQISQRDPAGHPVTVTGIVLDTTHRHRAEEALVTSEDRFRKMFHGHSATQLIIDPATGAIVDANAAAARFYGWSIDALKQMHIQQINDLPAEAVEERLGTAVAAANTRFEFQHRRADGSVRDVEVYSNRVELAGRAYLYSIIHDISDRKHAERALKVSEQRFRMLAENVADAVWVLDEATEQYQYFSPSIERITGYSAEESMLLSMSTSLSAESYARLGRLHAARMQEFARGEERTYVDIVEQTHKNGSRVIVEVHSRFVRNEASGRLEAIGVSRDITERRRVEEALQAVHDRLHRAEEFARFGHWEFTLDERIMHASEGATRLYGFSESDIPLSVVQRCVLSEYRPGLDLALRNLIDHGVPYDREFKIHRRTDDAVVDVHSKAEFDAESRTVFGVVQDITERKQSEAEREQLIAELQQAVDQVKTLSGIVPICASCKKIRDDEGFWEQVEAYVARHTDAHFSHGFCPDCMEQLYPDV